MIACTSPVSSVSPGIEISAMSARPAMSVTVTVGRHVSAEKAATAATWWIDPQRRAMSKR